MKYSTVPRFRTVRIRQRRKLQARVLGLGVAIGKHLSYDVADPASENVCFVLKMYAGGVGDGILATNGKRHYRCRYTKWETGRPVMSETMVTQGTMNQAIREWKGKNV